MTTTRVFTLTAIITVCTIGGLYLYRRAAGANPPSHYDESKARLEGKVPVESYTENPVHFKSGDAELVGTLTSPTNETKAAVLLIGGSGPLDRNGKIGTLRPYALLAHHLARCGIATLRYDKRGVGESTGDYKQATVQDFAADAHVALQTLREHYQQTPCGVIGHSEGAIDAAMLAAGGDATNVNFLLLLAAPGLDGESFCIGQASSIGKSLGLSTTDLASLGVYLKSVYAIADSSTNGNDARRLIVECYQRFGASLDATNRLRAFMNFSDQQADVYTSPWTKSFLKVSPQTLLKNIHCPTLVLQGDKDVQVPLENFNRIQALVKEQSATNFTLELLPSHNHLLQKCETGYLQEYARIRQGMSPDALNHISGWIGQNARL